MLFETQIDGRIGSPSAVGSISHWSAERAQGRSRRPRDARHRPGEPAPRQRRRVEINLAAIDRRTGKPGNPRHRRKAAPTRGPHLTRRKQSPPPLVELRANRFPPLSNRIFVDHATDLRLCADNRNPAPESLRPITKHSDSVILRSTVRPSRRGELPW
jgi:hypothetical protein